MEHGRDLGRRLRGGKIFGRFWVGAALEVVGDVAVLAEKGEELQQEVAEVLPDAKPPWEKNNADLLESSKMDYLH